MKNARLLTYMDYKKIHDAIIERARTRILTGYKERHHIVPRCMGGTNHADNLVYLTAREHFIIHKLLCEIYPSNHKLLHAHWLMANKRMSSNQSRIYHISNREYQRLKEQLSHTPETIEKLRNVIRTAEQKENISKTLKRLNIKPPSRIGSKHSPETKEKIRKALSGKPRNIDIINKIKKTKLERYGDATFNGKHKLTTDEQKQREKQYRKEYYQKNKVRIKTKVQERYQKNKINFGK